MASMDIVMVSSSSPATAFSLIGNPPELSFQTLPTSAAGSRYRGTYAPYPTMPTSRIGFNMKIYPRSSRTHLMRCFDA